MNITAIRNYPTLGMLGGSDSSPQAPVSAPAPDIVKPAAFGRPQEPQQHHETFAETMHGLPSVAVCGMSNTLGYIARNLPKPVYSPYVGLSYATPPAGWIGLAGIFQVVGGLAICSGSTDDDGMVRPRGQKLQGLGNILMGVGLIMAWRGVGSPAAILSIGGAAIDLIGAFSRDTKPSKG